MATPTYQDFIEEKKQIARVRWVYFLFSTVCVSMGVFYSNFAPMFSSGYWVGLALIIVGAIVSYVGFLREGL